MDNMKNNYRMGYCDAYDKYVTEHHCENCILKEFFNVFEYEVCPYYGELVYKLIKIKKEELKRLKKYAKIDGDGFVSYYIRKAIREYLNNYG